MPSIGSLVTQRLVEQREAMRVAQTSVRAGEPSGVHDLRVAMRRLRSLLATFRPVFDATVTEPVRDELASASVRLGEARDGEVATDTLDRLLEGAELVGLETGAVAVLRARLRLDAVAGADIVEETLDSARYAALTLLLDDVVADPPLTDKADRDARSVARKRLRREGRHFAEHVAAARMPVDATDPNAPHGADEHAARLHAVRKSAKRLRYAAETTGPVTGKRVRRIGKRAKAVQSAIGDYHDAVITRAALRHLALDDAVGEAAAYVLGHLDADEQRVMASLEKESWRAVKDLEKLVGSRR